jgi:hypothetical protein
MYHDPVVVYTAGALETEHVTEIENPRNKATNEFEH